MMKKLFTSILLVLPTLLVGQKVRLDYNYSFHGNYNASIDDYSNNMEVDSNSNISVFIYPEDTKLIVTSKNDTLFNHHIYNIEHDENGMITYSTTNYLNEAIFMCQAEKGITMLYGLVEQTEQVNMHYRFKYFWANK